MLYITMLGFCLGKSSSTLTLVRVYFFIFLSYFVISIPRVDSPNRAILAYLIHGAFIHVCCQSFGLSFGLDEFFSQIQSVLQTFL